jgi:acyl-CoA thioesterase
MTCIDAGPGQATVRMEVRALHLNFNGSCHGGAIFALADTAFGLASNSHGILAAGIDAHIAFPAPARAGEVLTAVALEVSRSRRLAIYRVEVHAGNATLVAVFTGTVYITGKSNAAT